MAILRGRDDVDGGYGWVVTILAFLANFLIYGIMWTSGIFVDKLLDVFSNGNAAVSLISALNTSVAYGIGPLAGMMVNTMGYRITAMLGGAVAGIGLIISSFATSVYFLYASFGIVTGVGFGLAYLPFVTLVAVLFEKYRTIAMAIAVSGIGFGTFACPPVIRYFITHFGWRGAMLMTGALVFNVIVFGALLQSPRTSTRLAKSQPESSRKKGNFNLYMFTNINYMVLCINNLLFIFGLSIVYVHLPAFTGSHGLDKDTSALMLSAVGIANLAGRIAFGIFAKFTRIDPIIIYTVGFLTTGLATAMFPLFPTMSGLLTVSVIFGFLSACIGPMLMELIAETVGIELTVSGLGNLLLFEAIGNLLGPPCAGWLYQWTSHYDYSMYLAASAMVVSGVIMVVPLVRRKHMLHAYLASPQMQVLTKEHDIVV